MTESQDRSGVIASFACAALTIAAMATGIAIMRAMGISSGMEVARADLETLRSSQLLLVAAELIKIATGAALSVVVRATGSKWRTATLVAWTGYAAAVLIGAAGIIGLVSVLDLDASSPRIGMIVGVLGLLSLPATGIWAATIAMHSGSPAPKPLRITGLLLALSGSSALIYPPAGLAFGIVSLVWWILLGITLERQAVSAIDGGPKVT
jgi:hypothetical protein